MSEESDFCVDANVILRYVLDDHPELSNKAASIMDAMEDGSVTLACDPITLSEVVFVLTSFYKIPRESIVDSLMPIVKSPNLRLRDKGRYIHALELFRQTVRQFGDACCCAAAIEVSKGRLLSFDKKLSGVPRISRAEQIA